MGSYIFLSVGRFEVDWGKNNRFSDHSRLFLPGDERQTRYHYADDIRETKPAFRRPLRSVRRRLELLGYSIKNCRSIYEDNMAYAGRYEDVSSISWDQFVQGLRDIDVSQDGVVDNEGDYDLGEYAAHHLLKRKPFGPLAPKDWHAKRELGLILENLDPYVTLRLLAENPRNLLRQVVWRHADLLDGGWIEADELKPGLAPTDRYLVVTEGSSDAAVLRKSVALVVPDVADFFDFIDMSENYPFTGTGNLVRFCQGLVRIQIQNKVLVVFDNDTAGWDAFVKVKELTLPPTMHLAVLPDLPELQRFRTEGPSGTSREDVNRRAASIELYLDLRYGGPPKPKVRWTSYNDRLKRYQGELIQKEEYVRGFLRGRRPHTYRMGRLAHVWETLIAACMRYIRKVCK